MRLGFGNCETLEVYNILLNNCLPISSKALLTLTAVLDEVSKKIAISYFFINFSASYTDTYRLNYQ